jgi:hypothetical protein
MDTMHGAIPADPETPQGGGGVFVYHPLFCVNGFETH